VFYQTCSTGSGSFAATPNQLDRVDLHFRSCFRPATLEVDAVLSSPNNLHKTFASFVIYQAEPIIEFQNQGNQIQFPAFPQHYLERQHGPLLH
jgi:hypothetical protein